jgi:hypothetical protein
MPANWQVPVRLLTMFVSARFHPYAAQPEMDSSNPAPSGFAADPPRFDGKPLHRTGTGAILQKPYRGVTMPPIAAKVPPNRKRATPPEMPRHPQFGIEAPPTGE